MFGTVGSLNRSPAMWVSCHSSELAEHLPRPGGRWRWGESNLSQSVLHGLNERGWISQVDKAQRLWITSESIVSHVGDYDRCDPEDVGVPVLSLLNVEAVRLTVHLPGPERRWRRSECSLRDDEMEEVVRGWIGA